MADLLPRIHFFDTERTQRRAYAAIRQLSDQNSLTFLLYHTYTCWQFAWAFRLGRGGTRDARPSGPLKRVQGGCGTRCVYTGSLRRFLVPTNFTRDPILASHEQFGPISFDNLPR